MSWFDHNRSYNKLIVILQVAARLQGLQACRPRDNANKFISRPEQNISFFFIIFTIHLWWKHLCIYIYWYHCPTSVWPEWSHEFTNYIATTWLQNLRWPTSLWSDFQQVTGTNNYFPTKDGTILQTKRPKKWQLPFYQLYTSYTRLSKW